MNWPVGIVNISPLTSLMIPVLQVLPANIGVETDKQPSNLQIGLYDTQIVIHIQNPSKTGVMAVFFKYNKLDKTWVQIMMNGIDTINNNISANSNNNNNDNNDNDNNDNFMSCIHSHVVSHLSAYEVDMRVLHVSGYTHNNQVYCIEFHGPIKMNDTVANIHCTKVDDDVIAAHCTIFIRKEHSNNKIGAINLLMKLYLRVMMLIGLYSMSFRMTLNNTRLIDVNLVEDITELSFGVELVFSANTQNSGVGKIM